MAVGASAAIFEKTQIINKKKIDVAITELHESFEISVIG